MSRYWLSLGRIRLYSAGFLAVYLAFAAVLLVTCPHGVDRRGNSLQPDFVAYWGASYVALHERAADAYDVGAVAGAERIALPALKANLRWLYPPTFLLVILPLSLLPFFCAYLLFAGGTFAAFMATLRAICVAEGLPMAAVWWPLLAFPGVFVNLVKGQNGLLTAALMGGALLLLRSRPLWSGVLIGLLGIKPHLGLLVPVALVAGRHWRVLLSALITAAVFTSASVALLGPDTLEGFWSSSQEFAHWAVGNVPLQHANPGLFVFFHLLGLPVAVAMGLHSVAALAVAGAVAWIWCRCADFSLRAAALSCGSMLISPYLLDYDLTWLALAIAWFTSYTLREGWQKGEREVLALAWLLPLLTFLIHRIVPLQLDAFVLLGLFLMIWRRARQAPALPDGTRSQTMPL